MMKHFGFANLGFLISDFPAEVLHPPPKLTFEHSTALPRRDCCSKWFPKAAHSGQKYPRRRSSRRPPVGCGCRSEPVEDKLMLVYSGSLRVCSQGDVLAHWPTAEEPDVAAVGFLGAVPRGAARLETLRGCSKLTSNYTLLARRQLFQTVQNRQSSRMVDYVTRTC